MQLYEMSPSTLTKEAKQKLKGLKIFINAEKTERPHIHVNYKKENSRFFLNTLQWENLNSDLKNNKKILNVLTKLFVKYKKSFKKKYSKARTDFIDEKFSRELIDALK